MLARESRRGGRGFGAKSCSCNWPCPHALLGLLDTARLRRGAQRKHFTLKPDAPTDCMGVSGGHGRKPKVRLARFKDRSQCCSFSNFYTTQKDVQADFPSWCVVKVPMGSLVIFVLLSLKLITDKTAFKKEFMKVPGEAPG